MNREEGIRTIAYHIWEEEGYSCQGRDIEHWLKAEAIWDEQNKPAKTAAEIVPPVRNQPINTAGKTRPAAKFNTYQSIKDKSSKGHS